MRADRCCIEIMVRAVGQACGSIADVIRTRIMLTDIGRWKEAAPAQVLRRDRPVSTFVQIAGFIDPEWLVKTEADCVARSH